MYLTEIAPINIRGSMGVLHQFALTMGILVSQICGLRQVFGNIQNPYCYYKHMCGPYVRICMNSACHYQCHCDT